MKIFILILSISFIILSCDKKEENPTIITISAVPISSVSCIAKGIIDNIGNGGAITDHGFIWYVGSTDQIYNPVKVSLGITSVKDTFSSNIQLTNSISNTDYKFYVRAYLTNSKGTMYAKAISFDPPILSASNIQPSKAKTGDTITIFGNNFDLDPTKNFVQFYNYNYFTSKVVAASKTKLRVIVPDFSGSSYYSSISVIITTGGQSKTISGAFSLISSVSGFSPKTGTFGTTITIYGANLSQSSVLLGNTSVYSSSSNNSITFTIPYYFTSKKFKIYVLSGGSSIEVPGGQFVMNSLSVTSFSPTTAYPGTDITIAGSNFNSTYNYNTLLIGSTSVTPSYSTTSSTLVATIPNSLYSGDYRLSVSNGIDTVQLSGTIKIRVPSITGITPTSVYSGSDLTINGHNLNTSNTNVYFNNSYTYYPAYSFDSLSYKLKVPNLSPGTYRVYLQSGSNQIQAPSNLIIQPPVIDSIAPKHGNPGTSIVIWGKGFSNDASNVYVKFGGNSANVSSVNNNQINAIIPNTIGNGTWIVSVSVNGYAIPNTLTFSVP